MRATNLQKLTLGVLIRICFGLVSWPALRHRQSAVFKIIFLSFFVLYNVKVL